MIRPLCFLASLPRRFEERVDRADANAFIRHADAVSQISLITIVAILAGTALSGIVLYAFQGQ